MKKKAKQHMQQAEIYLSACIIVRDGEQDMDWCLSGLEGEADELIVVDTGSKDRTKEMVRRSMTLHGRMIFQRRGILPSRRRAAAGSCFLILMSA